MDALDAEETALVEENLRTNGSANELMHLLKQGLEPLECDPGPARPPDGLAQRACTRLWQVRAHKQ